MLLQEYQGHQITVEGRDQSHNTNTGEMSHLLKEAEKVMVISSSSGVTLVCRLKQELGGRANSPGKQFIVIQLPPSQTTHTAFLQRAKAITNFS